MDATKPYNFIRFGAAMRRSAAPVLLGPPGEVRSTGPLARDACLFFLGTCWPDFFWSVLGSGPLLGALKPSKNVGGFAPHIFGLF